MLECVCAEKRISLRSAVLQEVQMLNLLKQILDMCRNFTFCFIQLCIMIAKLFVGIWINESHKEGSSY